MASRNSYGKCCPQGNAAVVYSPKQRTGAGSEAKSRVTSKQMTRWRSLAARSGTTLGHCAKHHFWYISDDVEE